MKKLADLISLKGSARAFYFAPAEHKVPSNNSDSGNILTCKGDVSDLEKQLRCSFWERDLELINGHKININSDKTISDQNEVDRQKWQ